MATRTSRAVFGDITNAGDSVAALAGKKPLKSERKADDVDARDASNPQAVTEYVNDMRAAASAFYRLFFAAAARAVSAPPPFGFRRRSRVDGVGGGAADRRCARCRDGTRCESTTWRRRDQDRPSLTTSRAQVRPLPGEGAGDEHEPDVHAAAGAHQREDARDPHRLAGRGAPQVQARARDAVPHGEPHRPLPARVARRAVEPAARRRVGAAPREQVRGDLPAGAQGPGLHHGQGLHAGADPRHGGEDGQGAQVQDDDRLRPRAASSEVLFWVAAPRT